MALLSACLRLRSRHPSHCLTRHAANGAETYAPRLIAKRWASQASTSSFNTLDCLVLLPNADDAIIDAAKLRDYLLSTQHPLGRFKARFFGALGFSADRWQELESALRTQHLTQLAEQGAAIGGGQKFMIQAILTGPNGQTAVVVSVWFVRLGEAVPRFVTAYPGGSQ